MQGGLAYTGYVAKIIIVEDNQPTRERIASVIEQTPDLVLLGSAATLAEGYALLAEFTPDVVLTDLGLPDGSGIDLIKHVRGWQEPAEAMVISVFGDERNVIAALEAGAAGYILKDDTLEQIGESVHQLLAGGSPISPSIARHLLRRFQSAVPTESEPNLEKAEKSSILSLRETDVLTLVAKGYTYNEIADMLGISFHTVSSHIKHIYRKLEVGSRSEAVFEAINLHLIDLD